MPPTWPKRLISDCQDTSVNLRVGDESDSDAEGDDNNGDSDLEHADVVFPTDDFHIVISGERWLKGDKFSPQKEHWQVINNVNVYKAITKYATAVIEGEKRLQSANETRWNSQIVIIRSVLNVSEEKLNKLDTVHLTSYERKLLKNFVVY